MNPLPSDSQLGEFLWNQWQQGQSPKLADVLNGRTLRTSDLLPLLRIDQQMRWQEGQRPEVEVYIEEYPVLKEDTEAMLVLMMGEFLLRENLNENPAPGEYAKRFPEFAERIVQQISLHRALASTPSPSTGSTISYHFHEAPNLDSAPPAISRSKISLPTIPGCEVKNIIGRGAMGVVYEGWEVSLKRTVAIKMIRAGAEEELTVRFAREAETVARLRHPHIVQIHAVGKIDEQPYLVMEYIAGGTLAQRLSTSPLTAKEAAKLIQMLAEAVEHAHRNGIVHRDLKPSNVLLQTESLLKGSKPEESKEKDANKLGNSRSSTRPGSSSTAPTMPLLLPKITDFGLAKQIDDDSGQTKSGAILGTPSYMAPEQAHGRNQQIGPATDVYALGAILYECLTGRPPFRGANVTQTLDQVRTSEPVPPRVLQPSIGRDIDTICLKCLEKDPAKRYQTSADLAEELNRYLDNRPILARPISRIDRLIRWCRRYPGMAVASGLTGIAILITMAVSLSASVVLGQKNDELKKTNKDLDESNAVLDQKNKALTKANQRILEQYQAKLRSESSLAIDRGWSLASTGELPTAMLWWALAVERANQANDPHLERVGRTLLAEWQPYLQTATAYLEGRWKTIESPDEKLVACWLFQDRQYKVQLINASTGALWGKQFSPNLIIYNAVVNNQGDVFIVDNTFKLTKWDTQKGIQIGNSTPLRSRPDRIHLDAKGTRLVVQSDKQVSIWDLENKILHLKTVILPTRPFNVALSQDSKYLAVGTYEKVAQIYEVQSGNPVGKSMPHPNGVYGVSFNPTGDQLVTVTGDKQMWTWEVPSGEKINERSHAVGIVQATYLQEGKVLRINDQHPSIQLLDAVNLNPLSVPVSIIHPVETNASREVVAIKRGVHIWNQAQGRRIIHSLPVKGEVGAVSFGANGELFTATLDSNRMFEIRRWETKSGSLRSTILAQEMGVKQTRSSYNSQYLWIRGEGLQLINCQTGKLIGGKMYSNSFQMPVFSHDSKRTLICTVEGENHTLKILDTATGKVVEPSVVVATRDAGRIKVLPLHQPRQDVLALSPTGSGYVRLENQINTGIGKIFTAQPWWRSDTATSEKLLAVKGTVTAIAYHPKGETILTGSISNQGELWDAKTGNRIALFPNKSVVQSVAFQPDGKYVVTGCSDGIAQIWDTNTKAANGEGMMHPSPIKSITFTPDGQKVMTCCSDGSLRFWDAETGKLCGPPLFHRGEVRSWAFSEDGKHLFVGSSAGEARIWELHQPIAEPIQTITRWAQRITHKELDRMGIAHELNLKQWQQLASSPNQ